MADAKHVDGIVEQVMSTLDAASPEVIFRLTKQLMKRVTGLEYQQLTVVDDEWECPHCFKGMSTDQLRIIDIEWRDTEPNGLDDDDFNDPDDMVAGGVLWFEDEGNDYADVALQCAYCRLPVSMPENWRYEWN